MRRIRQTVLFILVVMGLNALAPLACGAYPSEGEPAPNFLVESGDNHKLSLKMIRGRVVVLFYESRHVIKKNHELKDELTRLYFSQPPDIQRKIFRLVVIDCSEATWPTLPIWQYQLKANSRKEGFTIYGDWNKQMLSTYQMKPEESNFFIIDQRGIIRYAAVGRITNGQFAKIKKMLCTLAEAR
jgi:peroxiredoxin